MGLLRTIFIVVLAISIPLPATAAAFDASHCPSMSSAETGAIATPQQSTTHDMGHMDTPDCNCTGDAQCTMPCAAAASALPGIDLRVLDLGHGGNPVLSTTIPGLRPPHLQALLRRASADGRHAGRRQPPG